MATFGTFVNGVSLKATELNDLLKGTSFTPVIRQSNVVDPLGPTANDAPYGTYFRVNQFILYCFRFRSSDTSGSGTAGNVILLDLPVTAASSSMRVIGSGYYFDNNAVAPNRFFHTRIVQYSTTRAAFMTGSATSLTTYLGQTNGPALTVQPSDIFAGILMYKAA